MGGRRLAPVAIAALAGALALAPSARATFHEISIREVYPGSLAAPSSGYVELQMYAAGQRFVGGQSLTTYSAAGSLSGTFTFSADVSNGANQQTILIGDDGVGAALGVTPDLVSASFALDPAGGAACWAGTIDCVRWGAYGGTTPSASGNPADPLGIPNGMALRRTIAPGCPTLLELGDDSDDSATDLADATPQPRNNASAITEAACTGPTTTIDSKPANPTKQTAASFTYHASEAGASFECKLDAAAYASCSSSGIEYAGPLADGQHSFQVRAKSEAGFIGPAASYGWRVDTVAPTVTIDTHPTDPSPGSGLSFTFHASESNVAFECSLAPGAAADSFSSCASGKTYNALADGEYTFKVRGADAAANQGAPAGFTWTVDSSAVDTTPPDTVIDSAPPDPSESSSASFAYHSTEPESSFECKLDGAAFAPCPASGISYTGLADGQHSFQVRATDASDNTDPTPAGRTFSVAVPAPSAPPPAAAPVTESALAPSATPPRKKSIRCPRAKRKLTKAQRRELTRCLRRRCKRYRGKRRRRCLRKLAPRRRGKRGKSGTGSGATASSFHLVLLREIYPGSAASPNAEYVELQMYASGQEFVKGHQLEFFNAAGGSLGSVAFDADVANGGNQSTLLLATPEAEAQFGVASDRGFAGGKLDPAGGAVCWETLDCASWGGFSGAPGSPTGSPADPGGIPDGMALRRTIAPGCPTLLEPGDDSDNSAADFSDAFPAPRPNSVAPSERACGSAGSDGEGGSAAAGGKGKAGKLQTRLRRHPGRRTHDRTPTFRFSASRRTAIFLCKLDRQRFRRCRSPLTTRRLRPGRHVFMVKARIPGGPVDRTPARWRFRVLSHG